MTVADYRRLFAYEYWANHTVLDSLPNDGDAALRLFSHILASQRLWLDRLTGSRQAMPVWPPLSKNDCLRLLGELETDWSIFLDGLSDDRLATAYDYVNSKGQPWTSSIEDTLIHLITHSCYHRGQIAMRVREAGQDPAYTDFIHATRRGLI